MAATMMKTMNVAGVHAPSCACPSCGMRKSAAPLTTTPLRTRRVSKVRAGWMLPNATTRV